VVAVLHIPWAFSIYNLVEENSPHNIFSTSKKHILYWSHRIEEQIPSRSDGDQLYVGFQRLSYALTQARRYAKLATASKIYLTAVPDIPTTQFPSVNLIPLTYDHELAKEWYVLLNGRNYARLMAAREVTERGDAERTFHGVMTSDRDIIDHVTTQLRSALCLDMYAGV
jgi:DICT domain-containing protein